MINLQFSHRPRQCANEVNVTSLVHPCDQVGAVHLGHVECLCHRVPPPEDNAMHLTRQSDVCNFSSRLNIKLWQRMFNPFENDFWILFVWFWKFFCRRNRGIVRGFSFLNNPESKFKQIRDQSNDLSVSHKNCFHKNTYSLLSLITHALTVVVPISIPRYICSNLTTK